MKKGSILEKLYFNEPILTGVCFFVFAFLIIVIIGGGLVDLADRQVEEAKVKDALSKECFMENSKEKPHDIFYEDDALWGYDSENVLRRVLCK